MSKETLCTQSQYDEALGKMINVRRLSEQIGPEWKRMRKGDAGRSYIKLSPIPVISPSFPAAEFNTNNQLTRIFLLLHFLINFYVLLRPSRDRSTGRLLFFFFFVYNHDAPHVCYTLDSFQALKPLHRIAVISLLYLPCWPYNLSSSYIFYIH